MWNILNSLCDTLEVVINERGGRTDPVVLGTAAPTLLHGVRRNMNWIPDNEYANTPMGRADADALIKAIQDLMPVVVR